MKAYQRVLLSIVLAASFAISIIWIIRNIHHVPQYGDTVEYLSLATGINQGASFVDWHRLDVHANGHVHARADQDLANRQLRHPAMIQLPLAASQTRRSWKQWATQPTMLISVTTIVVNAVLFGLESGMDAYVRYALPPLHWNAKPLYCSVLSAHSAVPKALRSAKNLTF
jgi:hypothetical protein